MNEERQYQKGDRCRLLGDFKIDRCRLLGDFKIEHYDCDEWADGIITDVRTGKPVAKK